MDKKTREGVARTLRRAMELLEKKGWCKGALAIDENGDEVHPRSRKAVSFCMLGALVRVDGKYETDAKMALKDEVRTFVSCFNDAPGRRKSQVLAKFRAAIKRVEEGGDED